MGTIDMFQLPHSPPRNFLHLFFSPCLFCAPTLCYSPSFFPFLLCHLLLFITHCSSSSGRAGQSVSCRGPPVSYSADGHLGNMSSRQPGRAGTVGTGKAYRGETLLFIIWKYMQVQSVKEKPPVWKWFQVSAYLKSTDFMWETCAGCSFFTWTASLALS